MRLHLTIFLGLAFFAGAVSLALAVLIPTYSILSIRAFNDHAREMENLGEPLTIKALLPPPVFDDEDNFAKADIIQTLISDGERQSLGHSQSISLLDSLKVNAIPGYESPPFSKTRPVRYIENYSLHQVFPNVGSGEEAAQIILDYCDGINDMLDEIAAAATRPDSNFDLPYGEGYAMTFPDGRAFQEIGKLLQFRSRANLEVGNAAAAIESLETMLQISQHLKRENTLIYQLIALTIEGLVIDVIKDGMRNKSWNTEHCFKIEKLLRPRQLAPGMLNSLRMERAVFIATMNNMTEDTSRNGMHTEGFILWQTLSRLWVAKGWLADNSMKFSKLMQQDILNDETGNRRVDSLPTDLSSENTRREIGGSLPKKFRYLFVSMALPAYHGISQRFLREQTRLDLLRIAMEIERFRLEHNTLPASLDAAHFPLGGGGLVDPFSGSVYRYEKLDSGDFQLYSIGPNKIDEGGKLKKRPEDGDWVWRLSLPDDFDYKAYSSR